MFNIPRSAKINSQKKRTPSLYLIMLALTIFLVSFLLLLEKYKRYNSEISIIFVPKSEIAAQDAERVIGNMEILPTEMFFYDRMALYDEAIGDKISSFSDIKAEREKKSSIIKISALSKNRDDSALLAKTATTNLFNILGFYYDIKKDVDFRIVEGPVTATVITSWVYPLVFGLLSGLLSLLILNFIFKRTSGSPRNKKEGREKLSSIKFFEVSKEAKIKSEPTEEVYEIKAKPSIISAPSEKKSPAPENLPSAPEELTFIDEDYFRNNIIKGAKAEPEKTPEPAKEDIIKSTEEIEKAKSIVDQALGKEQKPEDFHREPTKEELKKRLNQLLRGEL